MPKKDIKAPAKKPAAAKAAGKSEPAVKAAARPAEAEAAPAKPKPQVPQRPVPPHQQFLAGNGKGGVKPQHMAKARIIRHQGR